MQSLAIVVAFLFTDLSLATNPAKADWYCRNPQIEIQCSKASCVAQNPEEITTMDVLFNLEGEFSICAYTGCWNGVTEVVENGEFVTLTKHNVEWTSLTTNNSMASDILIAFHRTDNVAMVKFAGWAHPFNCEPWKTKDDT